MNKANFPKQFFMALDSINEPRLGYTKKEVMEFKENGAMVGTYKLVTVEDVKKELVSKKIA